MNIQLTTALGIAVGVLLFPLAAQSEGDARAEAITMLKRDFKAHGIATMDRLDQDGLQAICDRTSNKPPQDVAKRLERDQMESVKYPADGKLMGDWKQGDKIAQNGKGSTWTDKPGPGGGSCYNCHQILKKEISFGNIGPSLNQYGALRGNTPEIQKLTYARIYNAKAFNLCSPMPRFGHVGALSEDQIKDLVALLLDPESPVNKK